MLEGNVAIGGIAPGVCGEIFGEDIIGKIPDDPGGGTRPDNVEAIQNTDDIACPLQIDLAVNLVCSRRKIDAPAPAGSRPVHRILYGRLVISNAVARRPEILDVYHVIQSNRRGSRDRSRYPGACIALEGIGYEIHQTILQTEPSQRTFAVLAPLPVAVV